MKVVSEYIEDGYKVEKLESGEIRYTHPDGEISTLPAPDPVLKQWVEDNIDPRIDLTKPIYEQAMRLWEQDRLEEERLAAEQRALNAA